MPIIPWVDSINKKGKPVNKKGKSNPHYGNREISRSYQFKITTKKNVNRLLYNTHKEVNRLSAFYMDFLLNLRGGLKYESDKNPVALLLNWFSPVSRVGSEHLKDYYVDPENIENAFKEELRFSGVNDVEIEKILLNCQILFGAAFSEEEAIWVNRAKVFRDIAKEIDIPLDLAREDAMAFLFEKCSGDAGIFSLKATYSFPPAEENEGNKKTKKGKKSKKDKKTEEAKKTEEGEENKKRKKNEDKESDPSQKSRQVFSDIMPVLERTKRFETGINPVRRALWENYLKNLISANNLMPVIPVRSLTKEQKQEGAKSNREFHSLAFAFAARAISSNYWQQKKAVSDKVFYQKNIEVGYHNLYDVKYEVIFKNLDQYCIDYTEEKHKKFLWYIESNTITGWSDVAKGFLKCSTLEERIEHIKNCQRDSYKKHGGKFGDFLLFSFLAEPGFRYLWENPQILREYVRISENKRKYERRKVAYFRIPDPNLHPIFLEFGNSKPNLTYNLQVSGNETAEIILWDGDNAKNYLISTKSAQFSRHICENRTGKTLVSRVTNRNRVLGEDQYVTYPFDGKGWPGKLVTDRAILEKIDKLQELGKVKEAQEVIDNLQWFMNTTLNLRVYDENRIWSHFERMVTNA